MQQPSHEKGIRKLSFSRRRLTQGLTASRIVRGAADGAAPHRNGKPRYATGVTTSRLLVCGSWLGGSAPA